MNTNNNNKTDLQFELLKIGMGLSFDVLTEIDNLLADHINSNHQPQN